MKTITQQTEQQSLDNLKEQVMNRITSRHPQLDSADEKALFQAVYDDYDENDVLQELYEELMEKMEAMATAKKNEEAEFESNLDQTIAAIEQMKKEESADGERIDEAVAWLQKVGDEVTRGRLLPDDIRMVMKGAAYDVDVAAADHDGEVRGRNYVIEEHLRTVKDTPTDVPALRGTGGVNTTQALPREVLGALAGTTRPTIWERGKEKRY